MSKYFRSLCFLSLVCLVQVGSPRVKADEPELQEPEFSDIHAPLPSDLEDIADHVRNDAPTLPDIDPWGCRRATTAQIYEVNLGNDKKDEFLDRCVRETKSSHWCNQLVHPNWNSESMFRCTYGSNQVHQLIHPKESTWKYAITAVKIVQELSRKNIKACKIYNWWRPEPYNKNVGGAKGRHPYGTSVDVRFCNEREANRAFAELCKMRSKRRIRAIGHYGSSSLHIGVGDRLANTWGKRCR